MTDKRKAALEAFKRIKANFRGFCRCEPNALNALCSHCYDFRDVGAALYAPSCEAVGNEHCWTHDRRGNECQQTYQSIPPEKLRCRISVVEDDISKCPKCGGEADNGNDRCVPPNPYYCTKCEDKITPPDTIVMKREDVERVRSVVKDYIYRHKPELWAPKALHILEAALEEKK